MTDLERPVPGAPFSNSDGFGTLSTVMLDHIADLAEANEDALTARTSAHIVTTDAYSDIVEVVLNTAEATTGWYSTLNDTADADPGPSTNSLHTTGAFSIQAYQKVPNNDLTSKLYVNLTEAGYPSGYTVAPGMNILADVQVSQLLGDSAQGAFTKFALTIASGPDLTGTVLQRVYSQAEAIQFEEDTWYTLVIPVGALTNIQSIGMKKAVINGTGSTRNRWHMDNIRRAAVTPLDQAYGALPQVTAVVPTDYTTGAEQRPLTASAGKSILDLRPEKIHNGVKWLDDYQIDTTGATDVTHQLQTVLDSLTDGDVLVGNPDHIYEVEGTLDLDVPGVTWNFNGAKLMQKIRQEERIIVFRAQRCVVKNGHIFGFSDTDPANSTGSLMTTVAGSSSNVGTTKQLTTIGDEVRIPTIGGTTLTSAYARDHLFRNRWGFTLHDTVPIAGDCIVQVKDPRTNAVLYTETLNLTSTPTLRTVYYTPSDITTRLIVTVKKAAGTGNVIITNYINYGSPAFNTTYEENFGFAVSRGGDDCVVENFLIEGVSGDGIGVNTETIEGGAQRFTARNVTIKNVGRQGIAPCGGRNHQFINCTVIHGARHAVDFEPETSPDAIDNTLFKNFYIYEPQLGPAFSSAQGWTRTRNVKVEGLYARMNTGVGAIGGGYNGAHFHGVTIVRTDDSSIDDTFACDINGRNITLSDWKTDEGISVNMGSSPQTDDLGNVWNAGGFVLRNIHFTKHPHMGYIEVNAPKVHLENITADTGDGTFDATKSSGGIGLLADTTYTNVNLVLHRTSLPNSWKGIATGQAWFPAGLDLKSEPLSRVRALSGGTTKGNNLGALAQAITAASTTATVAFGTKAGQNITLFTLLSTTGGTLTPSTTYYYRVAGRPRRGGPMLALAEKSVTLAAGGNATQITVSPTYSTSTGFYVDGMTIYRGTVAGTYTTRFDIVPTADLNGWGAAGGGNPFAVAVKDLGTTVGTLAANQFFHGYSFPYSTTVGSSFVPADETGFEPDTNYAVFIEPSWHTTWRVTAKRTNGFDVEFGVPVPTGSGNTFSWMIARF